MSITIRRGLYKNHKLHFEQASFRPTMSKIREAIFNIIEYHKDIPANMLHDAAVLDLCSGSGLFGFEALSMGAKSVVFVDKSRFHMDIVTQNSEILGVQDKCSFIIADAALFKTNDKFDIIYIDPPYNIANKLVQNAVANIMTNKLLNNNALLIIECAKHSNIDLALYDATLRLLDQRIYGNTKLLFYKYGA